MSSPPIAFISQRDFEVIDVAISKLRILRLEERDQKEYKTLWVMALTAKALESNWRSYEGIGLDEKIVEEIDRNIRQGPTRSQSLLNGRFSDPSIEVVLEGWRGLNHDPVSASAPIYFNDEHDALVQFRYPTGRHSGVASFHLQFTSGEWVVLAHSDHQSR